MKLNETVMLSCNALSDRKVRTILTVLMVVVGSSLIVILNGLSAGQSEFIKNQLSQLAPEVLYMTPGQQSFRGDTSPASITLTDVVINRINAMPYVKDVIPQYRGSIQLNSQGNIVNTSVMSMDPQKIYAILPKVEFEDGSLIKSNDPNAMVVGYNVANPPGKAEPIITVGQSVRTTFSYIDSNGVSQKETRSFVVSAVMKLTGTNQIDESVIVNTVGGNSLLHKSGRYDRLAIVAQSAESVDTVQQEITTLYGSTVGIVTPRAVLSLRAQFTSGNNAFVLSVGYIALIVGAVGIVTTLYTSVTERIREIGTIKAIGAQNTTILSLFLVEALLIGIIGASLGLVAGIIGGYGFGSFLSPPPTPGSRAITIAPIFLAEDLIKIWILSVALSVGAGIFPAWKASRLSPMIALRRE